MESSSFFISSRSRLLSDTHSVCPIPLQYMHIRATHTLHLLHPRPSGTVKEIVQEAQRDRGHDFGFFIEASVLFDWTDFERLFSNTPSPRALAASISRWRVWCIGWGLFRITIQILPSAALPATESTLSYSRGSHHRRPAECRPTRRRSQAGG